ncbi:hypothetical protein HOD75_02895 [archaeon]|jgi:hypothetical protein|nr:hypothetical protein [archaeon]MBT4241821.1 hypothetical protein [archaeon]MBT4418369.1 hypothetical protein [archaeon]
MAKIDYDPKTLDDKIIVDGHRAVATLKDNPLSRGMYFVVGGFATQSYLPSSCRRQTCDIDLAVLQRLNKADFRAFSSTAREFLEDNGYEVSDRKTQGAFCLDYCNVEGDRSYIEFPRFSKKRFAEKKSSLEREREHARIKLVEGTGDTYMVASPEDIMVPKLMRSVNSFKRNPLFEGFIARMQSLSDEEVREKLEQLRALKLKSIQDPTDVQNLELFRFISDIYDIRLLSELAGANKAYLRESAGAWDTLKKPSFERDLLARSVLPDELIPQDGEW